MIKKNEFIKIVIISSAIILIVILTLSLLGNISSINPGKIFNLPANQSPKDRNEQAALPRESKVELPKVLYNLSGKITKLEANAIIFDATIISKDERGEIVSAIEPRKANIGPAAKISCLAFVNNSPMETKINFSDLKIGDYIEVVSDNDISRAPEFFAIQIRVLP